MLTLENQNRTGIHLCSMFWKLNAQFWKALGPRFGPRCTAAHSDFSSEPQTMEAAGSLWSPASAPSTPQPSHANPRSPSTGTALRRRSSRSRSRSKLHIAPAPNSPCSSCSRSPPPNSPRPTLPPEVGSETGPRPRVGPMALRLVCPDAVPGCEWWHSKVFNATANIRLAAPALEPKHMLRAELGCAGTACEVPANTAKVD